MVSRFATSSESQTKFGMATYSTRAKLRPLTYLLITQNNGVKSYYLYGVIITLLKMSFKALTPPPYFLN